MKPNRRNMSILLLLSITAGLLSPVPATAQEEKPASSKNELKAIIASAKTAEDHQRLAAYHRIETEGLAEKQREQKEDFTEYNRNSSHYPGEYSTMAD
jgi:hypothetical protein